MRTFQYRDPASDKFWNVAVRGDAYFVSFGRTGSKGQTQYKQFADPAEAQAAVEKLIRQKLAEGYRETTPGAGPATDAAAPSLGQALEEAILEHPDEVASYAAYADHLQEQGDPRGEFIQVQLALEDPARDPAQRQQLREREAALLLQHQAAWAGPWVAALGQDSGPDGDGQQDFETPKCGFRRGILTVVTVGEMSQACAWAFTRSPQTRLVRELRIGGWKYEGGSPGDALLCWPYFANLRIFQLGWTSTEEYGEYCPHHCGTNGESAHEFVEQMPWLEELYLFAHRVDGNKLFALPLPSLRVAQLYHSQRCGLTKLAKNPSLANLTHLLCHPHALEYGDRPYIRLADLRAIVNSPHLTSLKHLRLRLADFGDRGCEEIVKSGILKRLQTLDLRHGRIGDAGARALAASPYLKRLQRLDVSRNELTDWGIAALKEVGILVATDYQHDSTPDVDADEDADATPEMAEYLYEGDME
jgi:uncharacterized protein (TIGR02996 family)